MVFGNATIYISKPEVDFWLTEQSKKKAPERLSHWFKEAEEKVGPYLKAGKVKNFTYGKELFPGITISFDVDARAAAAQRIKTFRDAAAQGYWLAADHVSFPGVGHVQKQGAGFRWVPINYSTLGTRQ